MKKYTLHSINPFSLFKFGFFIGLIVSFLPLMLVFLFLLNLATKLFSWLGNISSNPTINLPIIGNIPIDINVLQLLGLQDFYNHLNTFVAIGALQVLLFTIFLSLAFAIFIALMSLLAGLIFNLISAVTGGLQVTLSEKGVRLSEAVLSSGLNPNQSSKLPIPAPQVISKKTNETTPQSASPTQEGFISLTPSAVAPTSPGPRLEIMEPWNYLYTLAGDITLIGSDPACQLRLTDLQPRHAQISYEDGRYILRDLSLGQSWVQGQIVKGPVFIQDRYSLQFGAYKMNFFI